MEVPEEVLLAAKRLQEAQHTVTSAEQIQAAVLSVLEYIPVRSGLRRYVAQDHDPWCPFVRDGATSAAGAWDQIIPQQMDPNASWEVLFFWKDF